MKELNFDSGQLAKTLRAFCEVVDNGSFSNAALELNTSQPAVSLQIQALEQHLKTILFERKGPKIQITPDGKRLYELAKPIMSELLSLPDQFKQDSDTLISGNLTLIGGEAVLLNLLPGMLKVFYQQYPDVRIIIKSTIVKSIPEILLADKADFAIGSLFEEHDELIYHPIHSFSPILIMPIDHPLRKIPDEDITLEDIVHYGLIMPPEYSYTWRAVQFVFQQHKLDCPTQMVASSSEAVKRYVAAGIGISILTEACQFNEKTIKSVSMTRYFPMRSYGLIQRRGKFLSPQAQKFKEMVYAIKNPSEFFFAKLMD